MEKIFEPILDKDEKVIKVFKPHKAKMPTIEMHIPTKTPFANPGKTPLFKTALSPSAVSFTLFASFASLSAPVSNAHAQARSRLVLL